MATDKRYCLALDLQDDPEKISKYEELHQAVWPEIKKSILDAGIKNMEIYRVGTRLFMIMEVEDTFSFEKKNAMDKDNPKVQQWEELMWEYQQALPMAKPGEKWIMMKQIFALNG